MGSSNSVKSYKLSPNEHFSLDVQSGGDQSVSAELVLQKALDRENSRDPTHTDRCRRRKTSRSGAINIIVNIIDATIIFLFYKVSLQKREFQKMFPWDIRHHSNMREMRTLV